MANKCPKCDMVLTGSEWATGSCPVCQATFPKQSGLSGRGDNVSGSVSMGSGTSPSEGFGPVSFTGVCKLCGKPGPVQTFYLRTSSQVASGSKIKYSSMTFQSECCRNCFSRIGFRQSAAMLASILMVVFLLGGGLPLIFMGEKSALASWICLAVAPFAIIAFICIFVSGAWHRGLTKTKHLQGVVERIKAQHKAATGNHRIAVTPYTYQPGELNTWFG